MQYVLSMKKIWNPYISIFGTEVNNLDTFVGSLTRLSRLCHNAVSVIPAAADYGSLKPYLLYLLACSFRI